MQEVMLNGQQLSLENAHQIARGAKVRLHKEAQGVVEQGAAFVQVICKGKKPFYGINTGFGYFANHRISAKQLKQLQVNLLKSHSAGYGAPLTIAETRLAMALRLNVLLKGLTGVSWGLCQALCALVNKGIYPIIPEHGSVGASGDLAPLAHLALPLIGEGKVRYQNRVVPAKKALQLSGLKPYRLKEKEGLSLVNGTQIMLAVGGLAILDAIKILDQADLAAALSYEALVGGVEALHPFIHLARGQTGQIGSAQKILEYLEGSYLFDKRLKGSRVQDPYSLRCAPQIHGPSRDALSHSRGIIIKELNAATDNPLVFYENKQVLSGGNFHGQSLAFAFDFAAIALSEIGNVSERRLELLLNPHLSGLPAFLTPHEGVQSGYMAIQYLSASLVNENKGLANPACTDSIPGNVGIEDHVSMGMTSARKLKRVVCNIRVILAAELLAAAQAIDLRKIKKLGNGTRAIYEEMRESIPTLKKDRILSEEIEKMVHILEKR